MNHTGLQVRASRSAGFDGNGEGSLDQRLLSREGAYALRQLKNIVECFSSQSAVLINDKAFQRKPQEAVMGRRDVVTVE